MHVAGTFTWPSGERLVTEWNRGIPQNGGVFSSARGEQYGAVEYGANMYKFAFFNPNFSCDWSAELLDLFREHVAKARKAAHILGQAITGTASGGSGGDPNGSIGGGTSSAEGSRTGTPIMPLSPEMIRRVSGDASGRGFVARSSVSTEPTSWLKLQRIGRGAFGDVFQCLNTEDGSCFAAKQVPTGSKQSETSKEARALSKELGILKKLRHQNIVGYLGTQSKAGVLYVFMELVTGGDISSMLASDNISEGFPVGVIRRCGEHVLHCGLPT